MLSMVRTSAKQRRPQRPEFADTTVWEVAHFERRLSTGHANVVITSLRKCTRGGVIVINSPLNLNCACFCIVPQFLLFEILSFRPCVCTLYFLPSDFFWVSSRGNKKIFSGSPDYIAFAHTSTLPESLRPAVASLQG